MKGEVVYLYAFDVANEIITDKVKEIFSDKTIPFEIKTDQTLPKDVPLYKPLSIEPAKIDALLNGQEVRPLIHIYEIGVVSITMRVSYKIDKLQDLLPLHRPVLENNKTMSQAARELCIETYENLKTAMINPSPIPEPEAYTAFCFTDIGKERNVNNWLEKNGSSVAELLTENQPGVLSKMQINEVLRIQRSYTDKDLAIIDWDSALVVDLTGYIDDVLHVLELANLQLEEYKVMDKKLDIYLNKAYEDTRLKGVRLFGSYSRILRNLRVLRMDITKLSDEVTNITKFFGDWYLAQIYQGVRERFHLSQWKNSVEERLKQLDTIYTVVQNQVANFRMLWLEILIVLFFAIDLLVIFFLKR